MSTDYNLSKAQLSKIVQSGWFLADLLGKLARPLMKVGTPVAKNLLTLLATRASDSSTDGIIQRKMREKGAKRAGKEITLVTSIEKIEDMIRIIFSSTPVIKQYQDY